MAGASSSYFPDKKYDVFISFGGKDTRTNFLSHLVGALHRKKIRIFMDEKDLKIGDQISPALEKAIEGSTIYVIILSENYAFSSWCLNELDHILQCKEKYKRIVVPVFYHVDPSDVRKQQKNYAAAFATHELRFKDEIGKVQQWRDDLKAVANLSGFHLSTNFRSEYDLVEAILKDILEKLSCISASDDLKGLIGIEKRVEKIESFLNIASSDVRIICLWGMGGIGKTTLARVVFNRIAHQFEGRCFLEDVREGSKEFGLKSLQRKLFSELLKEKSLDTVNGFLRDGFRRTKVLVVLDDVDDADQLEYLAGDRSWFCDGSRIIVTSRDMEVLNSIGADETYEVEKLNSSEAQHLFSSKAFRQNSSTKDYVELLARSVNYADGIPLALIILGRHLFSKNTKEWKSELDKLNKFPNKKVYNVLKVSYDGLDENAKNIFLDIAHFFKGMDQDFVKGRLDANGLFADIGIRDLRDKSLLTIKHSKIRMHDLLHQMGLEIVRLESKEPGKRSRLCLTEDVSHVLRYNTPTVFKKLYLPEGLESLPNELRYLRWSHYPLKSLPSDFTMLNLVEMHLGKSQLQHLWDGVQHFGSLKVLNLQCSENLTQIPDLSLALSLEKITLKGCVSMGNLPSSVGKLESLQSLDLSDCSNIDRFPELPRSVKHLIISGTSIEQLPPTIEHLCHLETFDLSGCSEVDRFPELPRSIKHLNISGTSIEQLPPSIEHLSHLEDFNLSRCSGIDSLKTLPSSIHKLKYLKYLNLSDCLGLEYLPESLEPTEKLTNPALKDSSCSQLDHNFAPFSALHSLEILCLKDSGICEIPDWVLSLPKLGRLVASIKYSNLRDLAINDCNFLQYLPELPVTPTDVNAARCTSLEKVIISSHESRFIRDEQLQFNDCINLDCNTITNVLVVRDGRGLIRLKEENRRIPFYLPGVIISFPGNTGQMLIPEWFSHQNEGCFINMKLPPLRYDTNIMDFAACLVLARDNNIGESAWKAMSDLWLRRLVRGKTINGERYIELSDWFYSVGRDPCLPHVFMWYFYVTDVESSAVEMSFRFSAENEFNDQRSSIKVERCGIRMLSVLDAAEFGREASIIVRGGSGTTLL
ncbi:TMV resistance protein N [Morus notabilis]|nr:TMV resistance protein N [Morus notabilis]